MRYEEKKGKGNRFERCRGGKIESCLQRAVIVFVIMQRVWEKMWSERLVSCERTCQ